MRSARCSETGTPGAGSGPGKRAGRKTGTEMPVEQKPGWRDLLRHVGVDPIPATSWGTAVFASRTPTESRTAEQIDALKLAAGPNHVGLRIFIRGDENMEYGKFLDVMNTMQDNGFYSVALVGEDRSGVKK